MSNVTIFEQSSNLPTIKRESKLADKMGSGGGNLRRIGLNTNGTFKRIVNGEQIGKAVPHELNVIIVDLLKDVSRTFYEGTYDPNAKPTLPDCWSNLGDRPDPRSSKPQSGTTCADCVQNTAGSGAQGRGKACRYQRRLAVLVEGDPSGDLYQLNIPAKSLFGKGVGNVHPFESYKNYLRANGEGVDTIVTKVMYDLDADTMALKFKAVRHLMQEEADMVDVAQNNPETQRYIQLTPAETNAPKAHTAAPAAKVKPASVFDTPEEAEEAAAPVSEAPTKRASKKQEEAPAPKQKLADMMSQWGDED